MSEEDQIQEVTEALIKNGKIQGKQKTPETLRIFLSDALKIMLKSDEGADNLSDEAVFEQAHYYANTNPLACDLYERRFGPIR